MLLKCHLFFKKHTVFKKDRYIAHISDSCIVHSYITQPTYIICLHFFRVFMLWLKTKKKRLIAAIILMASNTNVYGKAVKFMVKVPRLNFGLKSTS